MKLDIRFDESSVIAAQKAEQERERMRRKHEILEKSKLKLDFLRKGGTLADTEVRRSNPVIASPEEFRYLIEEYAAQQAAKERPMTLVGIALHLGFSGKKQLEDWGRKPAYADAVQLAKSYVEAQYEERLMGSSATGAIFALKQFGWSDRHEISTYGTADAPTRIELVAGNIVDGEFTEVEDDDEAQRQDSEDQEGGEVVFQIDRPKDPVKIPDKDDWFDI